MGIKLLAWKTMRVRLVTLQKYECENSEDALQSQIEKGGPVGICSAPRNLSLDGQVT